MARIQVKKNRDGSATVKAKAEGNEDLRDTFREKRFLCTEETPWSGKREDAPHGVRHVDATTDDEGVATCPHCKASWVQR